MNIQKKLSLNKHPGDCVPYSLVAAKNVKISNDDRMIVNEEGLEDCSIIANSIHEDGINNFKIVGVIPTSTELILFVINVDNNESYIYRYNEESSSCYRANSNWKYNGGKIKGTYTYNVKNHLIIAVAESDASVDVPLKTINIDLDSGSPDTEMSIIPQVTLPTVSNLNYVSGAAYKGFYFMFIRYKIDKTNYTKWYSIGFPIFNDVIIPQVINKVCFRKEFVYNPKDDPNGYCYGNSDSFSDSKDICNQTFEVSITGGRSGLYQLGLIICKKDSTQAFRTDDLNSNIFKFSRDVLVEYNIADLTTDYYNYYNVGNIINYKNRIYIANYDEKSDNDNRTLSDGKTLEESVNDIVIKLRNKSVNAYYNSYNVVYAVSEKGPYFKMASLGFTGTVDYGIADYTKLYNNNQYPFRTFKTFLNETVIQGIAAHEYLKVNYNTVIKVGSKGGANIKEYLACNCFIIPTSYKYENNISSYSLPSEVKIVCYTYNSVGFTEDAVFTSGVIIFGTAQFDIDNCKMRITHSIIDPSYDFNERKKNDTLIPGEVYNFFIHFVDKYGDASRGYKLSNKDKYINDVINDNSHCTIITVDWINGTAGTIPYWVVISGTIPISSISSNVKQYIADSKIVVYTAEPINNPLTNILLNSAGELGATNRDDLYTLISNYFIDYQDKDKYNDLYVYQVINSGSYTPTSNQIIYGNYDNEAKFGYYENINGDELFRIPDLIFKSESIGGEHTRGFVYNMNDTFNKFYINVNIDNNLWNKIKELGYVGWFVSYEKVEPITRYTGLLTRKDFANIDSNVIWQESNYAAKPGFVSNNYTSDKCYLYSGRFDIDDTIKYDFNIIRIDGKCTFEPFRKKSDVVDMVVNTTYPYSYNMPVIGVISRNVYKPINNYKLVVADSIADDRAGKGTALEMDDYKELSLDAETMFLATVLNCTRNIYINKEKELIRLNDVRYSSGTYSIEHGYNGRMTYDGVLVYNDNRVIMNEGDYRLYSPDNIPYYYIDGTHPCWFDKPFVEYIQFPLYSDKFFESKCFNNEPSKIAFSIKEETDTKSVAFGTFVEPKNSVDLFKDPIGNVDQFVPKLLTQYRNDIINITRFDKTIRRSNIIQDESEVNAWRVFPIEGYKNITENKGIITNLVGIGYYLLVHTQHSMFMFDISAALKTRDENVQLYQPDAFEVDYKEVFTSDKGYGGLQDDLAYIVGEFGYIFYNDDFHTLYQFDDGQLKLMYEDIKLWLDKYRPNNVRFAHDKYNNRILIKFDYTYDNINPVSKTIIEEAHNEVISFNYKVGSFISLHDYYFNNAWSTKTKCYFQTEHNNDRLNCPLHVFTNEYNYGRFNTHMGDDSNSLYMISRQEVGEEPELVYNSYIDIIINESYELIKFLEFIKYKVRKIYIPFYSDNTNNPVDLREHPYAGDILRIFNEDNDTDDIDINIDKLNKFNAYKKPWYELTQYNFNYFRNTINKHPNSPSDKLRRVYGNYFIVRFIFNNIDNKRIEFESLECAQTQFRKL